MFEFRPANEAQVIATRDLFNQYEFFRQDKHPIYVQDDRPYAQCAVMYNRHPLSFLPADIPTECTYKNITFERKEIMFGPSLDTSRFKDCETIKIWFNRDVFKEYLDFLNLQQKMAAEFLKDSK